MDLSNVASLDFETGSRADLRKVGAAKYAEDPTTRVICFAYELPDGRGVRSWREGERFPADLYDWVETGGLVSGWNVPFEWHIWNGPLRKLFPVPELKLEHLIDTMAVAANAGLPLGLDMAAAALPELGLAKDKDGHALMLRMSRPRTVLAGGGLEWWDRTDPARRDRLVAYCEQDVRVERAILGYLPAMRMAERQVWLWDARIMARGIGFDRELAGKMKALADAEMARLDARMAALTGGAVPNTRAVGKLLAWVQTREQGVGSLAKDQLAKWIDKTKDDLVREVLETRAEAARSSVAKLVAMENWASNRDDRMRGLTQYYGAFRTGRWAGRGPQVQNYPRSEVDDQEGLVEYILGGGDPEGFEVFFGVDALTGLASALRGCLAVLKGSAYRFCAVDFSQIEARVLPWLARDQDLLDVFESGRDIYRVAAARIFGVPEGMVDGGQRQIGKVAVLALGYGGGAGAFQTMAVNYGLHIPAHEADQIKTDWREANPLIVRLWYSVERAALDAVRCPGWTFKAGRCEFRMKGKHLAVKLPSGRELIYREAKLDVGTFGNDAVSYMGVDQYTRQWTRIVTYGGKLVENITQAVARDVMASGMLRLCRAGYAVLGSVHDELLLELDPRKGETLGSVLKLFRQVPPWAAGLPIDAGGYEGVRFRKG